MKQILLALLIAGALPLGANAQTNSKFAQNYKVCINGDKYAVCNEEEKTSEKVGRDVKVTNDDRRLRMFDTYVHMGYSPATAYSNKNNPRIKVSYEDPNGAYEGKETSINDGVQKNIERNINYLDGSVQLPPNDGGN